jgi:hypothetical protein
MLASPMSAGSAAGAVFAGLKIVRVCVPVVQKVVVSGNPGTGPRAPSSGFSVTRLMSCFKSSSGVPSRRTSLYPVELLPTPRDEPVP